MFYLLKILVLTFGYPKPIQGWAPISIRQTKNSCTQPKKRPYFDFLIVCSVLRVPFQDDDIEVIIPPTQSILATTRSTTRPTTRPTTTTTSTTQRPTTTTKSTTRSTSRATTTRKPTTRKTTTRATTTTTTTTMPPAPIKIKQNPETACQGKRVSFYI